MGTEQAVESKAQYYQAMADQCQQQATEARDQDIREGFIVLARQWQEMAHHEEKRPPSPPPLIISVRQASRGAFPKPDSGWLHVA